MEDVWQPQQSSGRLNDLGEKRWRGARRISHNSGDSENIAVYATPSVNSVPFERVCTATNSLLPLSQSLLFHRGYPIAAEGKWGGRPVDIFFLDLTHTFLVCGRARKNARIISNRDNSPLRSPEVYVDRKVIFWMMSKYLPTIWGQGVFDLLKLFIKIPNY